MMDLTAFSGFVSLDLLAAMIRLRFFLLTLSMKEDTPEQAINKKGGRPDWTSAPTGETFLMPP
jgi:hypothetical protein